MLNVTVSNPFVKKRVRLSEMKKGSVGVTDDGKIFLATIYSAICLNDVGASYSGRALLLGESNHFVTLYPPGTVISLEVVA